MGEGRRFVSMAGVWRYVIDASFHAAGAYASAITMPFERDDPEGYRWGQSITLLDGRIVQWSAAGRYDGTVVDAGFMTVALTRVAANALMNVWNCPSISQSGREVWTIDGNRIHVGGSLRKPDGLDYAFVEIWDRVGG